MFLRFAADLVLLLHLGFILFAVFGALLAFRWRWMPLFHLPAAAWGLFVEVTGQACPLTALENALRMRAGASGYAGSFVEHYLLPVIYPAGLTASVQLVLGALVLAINAVLYAILLRRKLRPSLRHRPAP